MNRKSENDLTLIAYERGSDVYAARMSPRPSEAESGFIDRFVSHLAPAPVVLEVGSGTGRDAALLEARGVVVHRSDAASAFVEKLRRDGRATLLNVLRDDLGGPYDGIYANAVLHHVPRQMLAGLLDRCHAAVQDQGILAFTVKSGSGEAWSTEKLGLPRYFVYWNADDLRAVLGQTRWAIVHLGEAAGATADWLQVICRRYASQDGSGSGSASGSLIR